MAISRQHLASNNAAGLVALGMANKLLGDCPGAAYPWLTHARAGYRQNQFFGFGAGAGVAAAAGLGPEAGGAGEAAVTGKAGLTQQAWIMPVGPSKTTALGSSGFLSGVAGCSSKHR